VLSLLMIAAAQAACPDLSAEKKAWNSKALEALVDAARSGDPAEPIARVEELRDANDLCSPRDRYHAAVILLRGEPDDVESARILAGQSHAGGVKEAGFVEAQAMDKQLVAAGKLQSYGTMVGSRDGRSCLFPIDPDVTDAQRAELDLPPLRDRLADIVQRAGGGVEPTIDALREASMICGQGPSTEPFVASNASKKTKKTAGMVKPDDGGSGSPMGSMTQWDASKLHAGELYGARAFWSGNAYSMPKGHLVFHPLIRSAYGVTDWMDVKASLLGTIGGPNVNVEVAPLQTDDVALSIETGIFVGWNAFPDQYDGYGELKVTTRLAGATFLTVGAYGGQTTTIVEVTTGTADETTTETLSSTQLKPKLAIEGYITNRTAIVGSVRTNLMPLIDGGSFVGSAGCYLATAPTSAFAMSAGVNLNVAALGDVPDAVEGVVSVPDALVLPTPHLQLWFRG